jgi:hypothetical protein
LCYNISGIFVPTKSQSVTTKAERPQTESKYSQAKKGNRNPGRDDWRKTSIERRASKARAYRQKPTKPTSKIQAKGRQTNTFSIAFKSEIPEFFERQDQEQIRAARRRRRQEAIRQARDEATLRSQDTGAS